MLKVVGDETAQDGVDARSLLDEIAREGARRMLVAALETEVAAYLEAHRDERDGDGHALVVRNGKGRTRKVTVGAGTIPVSAPRVNDRRTDQDGERRRFTSRILPPYMRRSPKVAEVLPVLYLRGLSTGDFREALAALLGDDAAGLSATNIARLTNEWETEYRAFQKRSLADRRIPSPRTKNRQALLFPWTAELHAIIEERRAATQAAERMVGTSIPWVFHRDGQRGAKALGFRKSWERACRLAGCDGAVLHDLRRTAARNLVRAGVPERVVMELVGWRSRSMLDRYHIVNQSDLEDAARKLDALARAGPTEKSPR
jgi:integrase